MIGYKSYYLSKPVQTKLYNLLIFVIIWHWQISNLKQVNKSQIFCLTNLNQFIKSQILNLFQLNKSQIFNAQILNKSQISVFKLFRQKFNVLNIKVTTLNHSIYLNQWLLAISYLFYLYSSLQLFH